MRAAADERAPDSQQVITTLSLISLQRFAGLGQVFLRQVPRVDDVPGIELGLGAQVHHDCTLVQQAHCIGRSDGLAATARTAEFIGRRHECEQQRAADQERVPGGIFEQTFHQYDRGKKGRGL